jgi:hypothetical protein
LCASYVPSDVGGLQQNNGLMRYILISGSVLPLHSLVGMLLIYGLAFPTELSISHNLDWFECLPSQLRECPEYILCCCNVQNTLSDHLTLLADQLNVFRASMTYIDRRSVRAGTVY